MRNRRLNKIVSFILVIGLIICCFPLSAKAEEVINESKITSVSLGADSVEKGSDLTVNLGIDATDFGVTSATIQMQYYDSENNTYPIGDIYNVYAYWMATEDSEIIYNGTLSVNVPFAETKKDGEWHITFIELYDTRNNYTQYYAHTPQDPENMNEEGIYSGCRWVRINDQDYQLPSCEVTGTTINDEDNSKITGVSFVDDTVEKPGNIQVQLAVSAETYGVSSVTIQMNRYDRATGTYPQGEVNYVYGYWMATDDESVVRDGTITVNVPLTSTHRNGEWQIGFIEIVDTRGNYTQYYYKSKTSGPEYDEDGYNLGYRWMDINGTEYFMPICTVTGDASDENKEDSKLTTVRFAEDEVTRPGVAKIQIDIDADDYGVMGVIVQLNRFDKDSGEYPIGDINSIYGYWGGYDDSSTVYNGTITVEIPIEGTKAIGEWHIGFIQLTDKRGNNIQYYMSSPSTGEAVDESGKFVGYRWIQIDGQDYMLPKCQIVDEFDYQENLTLSSPELVNKVGGVSEGKAARIFVDDYSKGILPKEAFDAIKGKDITIVAYKGSYQWIINGNDITEDTKDVNLELSISSVSENVYDTSESAVKVEFKPNGLLPGKAQIRIKSDYLYNLEGIKGKLYLYYNNNGNLELQQNPNFDLLFDGTDKWCCFDITHNSEYIISGSEIGSKKHTTDGNSSANIKNDGTKNSSKPSSQKATTKTPSTKIKKYSEEWIKGKWYNKDGSQTYKDTLSWKCNSTGWWVEDSSGWYPKNQWQKIDGIWYYFKSDGYMSSNEYYNGYWFNSDGSWDSQYYLTWKCNSKGWWVEDKSGWWSANKWLKVDGDWYYFNGSGYMATSQYIDGWWVGANGVCR